MEIISFYIVSIVLAAATTILIEGAVAFLLGIRNKYDQAIIALVNLGTNVTLNLILMVLGSFIPNITVYYAIVYAFEVVVVLTEGFIYKKNLPKGRNYLLLSLILNLISYIVGSGLLQQIMRLLFK